MKKKFWNNRWATNDIGFHMAEPHSILRRFYEQLNIAPGQRVFVPLCGKSLDMLWLASKKANVTGVEFNALAVEAFFSENDLQPQQDEMNSFARFRSGDIELLCGDLFELDQAQIQGARACYDRGALVALPPDMRQRYVSHLANLLPAGSRVLLISYEYDQAETHGPPFSVPLKSVEKLLGANFEVRLLTEEDALPTHKGLQQRGLTWLKEFACLLIRK